MSAAIFKELPDLSLEGLTGSLVSPWTRLGKIADRYRRIAADLEAGKAVNPKKIKSLAGSLDYWANTLFNAGHFCLCDPATVFKAFCQAHRQQKVQEAQGKPVPEQQKAET